jgi:short chain dehydrogenase
VGTSVTGPGDAAAQRGDGLGDEPADGGCGEGDEAVGAGSGVGGGLFLAGGEGGESLGGQGGEQVAAAGKVVVRRGGRYAAEAPPPTLVEGSRRFAGKVVAITGATSGIGRAAALAFAREGATVAFCGRRTALGEQLQAQIAGSHSCTAARAPPTFPTPRGRSALHSGGRGNVKGLHRMATPEEIAAVAVSAASPELTYLTGSALAVSGGIGAG